MSTEKVRKLFPYFFRTHFLFKINILFLILAKHNLNIFYYEVNPQFTRHHYHDALVIPYRYYRRASLPVLYRNLA